MEDRGTLGELEFRTSSGGADQGWNMTMPWLGVISVEPRMWELGGEVGT